ncbi:HAD family hydrolase [Demequina flava]|uniref:HAD family hydrolase n=1 Tax=Demequina flava TaxID=1095025 RepID=UPI0007829CB6|nr:HAD family hydrolase [Demequina flava]
MANPTDDSLRGAAFFDVDNTVIRGASSYHIARGLQRHGFFKARDIFRFAWEQLKYTMLGESREQIEQIREEGLMMIKGWSVAEMIAVGEEVYDEILELRIFPGTRALIDGHLAAGREVWFITTSPQEVASIIAQRLGVTGAMGSQAEHVDGLYTGKLKGEMVHREAKAKVVRQLADERGLDLTASYAYGDSINDGPMLEAVAHPTAINPDHKLRRMANERGWAIEEFRKRRKDGRRGVARASAAGAVWAAAAVGHGLKVAGRNTIGRLIGKPAGDDERAHKL